MAEVMMRHIWRSLPALGALVLVAGPAGAEPMQPAQARPPSPLLTVDGVPGQRIAVDTPRELYATPSAAPSSTLYLERCVGGCKLHMGPNDARAASTMLILTPEATIGEFATYMGETGVAADAEWSAIVQCMKEVYSPFNVAVTDVKPSGGQGFHEAIIAGKPTDPGVGRTKDILGIAPLANDCSAIDNVISLTFANQHPMADRVLNICWTAAQESAHAFGLDHEYEFVDGKRSACNDPMTYRNDCGGEKFFRNESASCGENSVRSCRCGAAQNSHLKLLSVFGPGQSITGSPAISLTSPAAGSTLGSVVVASAGAKRGVARVELFLNGHLWAQQAGAPFGSHGQPDPSTYAIPVPSTVPNSIVDIKTIAYDDIGGATESPVVTVTKGAPCATADTCAKGQKCEAGKCFWDPPSGEIGDACSYAEFCKSGLCTGTKDQQICTKDCIPGVVENCPTDFECVMSSPTTGVCFFASSGGGCCRVDRDGDAGWTQLGFAALVLGLVVRSRRAPRSGRTGPAPRTGR
jgi:hypothetical protein